MLSSTSILPILSEKFKSEYTANACRSYARNHILRGETSRALDLLPDVIPERDLKRLSQSFLNLLIETNADIIANNSNKSIDPRDEAPAKLTNPDNFELWILDIAIKGCDELLDDNGNTNTTFIELMQWQDIQSQIKTCELISAYISTIYAQIANHNLQGIFQYKPAYTALTIHLNEHKTKWIEAIFVSKKFIPNPAQQNSAIISHNQHGRRWPQLNLWSLATGLVFAASIPYGAYRLFSRAQKQNPSNDYEEMQLRPNQDNEKEEIATLRKSS